MSETAKNSDKQKEQAHHLLFSILYNLLSLVKQPA
jgi:hypothetical protein